MKQLLELLKVRLEEAEYGTEGIPMNGNLHHLRVVDGVGQAYLVWVSKV